jgi:hypothetical protein
MKKRRMRRIDEELARKREWNAWAKEKGVRPFYKRLPQPCVIEIFWPADRETRAAVEKIDLSTRYGRRRFESFHVNRFRA